MQFNKMLITLLAVSLLVACKKSISPNSIDFDVAVTNNLGKEVLQFKVNDTINFRFTGNPDRITFFSGEIGRRYAYKNRTSDPSLNDTLRFLSQLNRAGAGQMQLLFSTDSLVYTQYNKQDSISIPTAKWTDISDRVIWPTTASTNNISSGAISLNQEASTGQGKIWLAFKYTAPAGQAQSSWIITNPQVVHYISDTAYIILTPAFVVPNSFPAFTASPGWGSVNVANPLIKWGFNGGSTGNAGFGQSLSSNGSTSSFAMNGNPSAATAVATENWLVTGPIDLKRVLPDAGVGIKNKGENAMIISKGFYASRTANFTYRFSRTGIYEITFLAQNDTESAQNMVVKKITLEIIS